MKRFTSLMVIIALLLVNMGGAPVYAVGEQLRVFNGMEKGAVQFVPDEIVVKFKNDAKPFRVVKIPVGKVREKIQEYLRRSDVAYAEPNYYAHAFLDDPFYQYQWNFHDQNEGGIRVEQAWSTSTGLDGSNNGVIVAIVDTGIAYEDYLKYTKAPDLGNTSFVPGYDFVNNDAHPNDDNSHGTHVAGTVAQSTNNTIGVAGIAYNARLMPVKVLNKKGTGTYDDIADGIYFAANNDAKVINLSLGGSAPSEILEDALAYAYDKGVTIVAAAGNDGMGTVSYPAAYDQYVIAVGATRYDKSLAPYSNHGTSLDLVAPGGDTSVDQNGDGYVDGILQNTFNPESKNTGDFGYWFLQGTSMASPHVAGVAALLIANGNATSPSQVQTALQETAMDLGISGKDTTYGYGLIDASAALAWQAVPNTAPSADSQTVIAQEDVPKSITLTGNDPEGEPLTYTVINGPYHGMLMGIAPNITYIPNTDYNGSDNFTFKVSDGTVDSNIAKVDIAVTPVNDPPVAVDQSVSTNINVPMDITLNTTDPDGDALTYSIDIGPSNGTLTWLPTGNIVTYAPNDGYTGTDSFTYTVSDSSGLTDSATVIISVFEMPSVPTINIDIDMTTTIKKAGKNTFVWAIARVSVGEPGALLPNATVTGHWEGATSDIDTGTSDLEGIILLNSDQVKTSGETQTFTFVVDSITLNGVAYIPVGETSDSITP